MHKSCKSRLLSPNIYVDCASAGIVFCLDSVPAVKEEPSEASTKVSTLDTLYPGSTLYGELLRKKADRRAQTQLVGCKDKNISPALVSRVN